MLYPVKKLKMSQGYVEMMSRGLYPQPKHSQKTDSTSCRSQEEEEEEEVLQMEMSAEMILLKKYFDHRMKQVYDKYSCQNPALFAQQQKRPANPAAESKFPLFPDDLSRIEAISFCTSLQDHQSTLQAFQGGNNTQINNNSSAFKDLFGSRKSPSPEARNPFKQARETKFTCEECGMKPIAGPKFYLVKAPERIFCINCYLSQKEVSSSIAFKRFETLSEYKMLTRAGGHRSAAKDHNCCQKMPNGSSETHSYLYDAIPGSANRVKEEYSICGKTLTYLLAILNTGQRKFPKATRLNLLDSEESIPLSRLEQYETEEIELQLPCRDEDFEVKLQCYSEEVGYFGNEIILEIELQSKPPATTTYIYNVRCRGQFTKRKGFVLSKEGLKIDQVGSMCRELGSSAQ